MKKGVTFAEDCVYVSDQNDEVLEKLLTEMFVEFVNNSCGKDILELK